VLELLDDLLGPDGQRISTKLLIWKIHQQAVALDIEGAGEQLTRYQHRNPNLRVAHFDCAQKIEAIDLRQVRGINQSEAIWDRCPPAETSIQAGLKCVNRNPLR
jgi:hypothetical protein